MTKKAAGSVFSKSGYSPTDVDVVELHDCFSANELITYEGLGLCAPGEKNRGLRGLKCIVGGDTSHAYSIVVHLQSI